MRQRGFIFSQPLIYLLAGIALVGAVAGLYVKVSHDGYERGEAAEKARNDKQREKDRAIALARTQAVAAALQVQDDKRRAAEQVAADSDAKLKEKVREARRIQAQLAFCDAAKPEAPSAGTRVAPPRVRLSWRAVGLLDGAHTGPDGQPVFQAQSEFALDPARADTPSIVGLDELIEVSGENSRALSTCLRAYGDAMSKINAAEAAWNKARPND